ncbi:reductive dehalogenase [Dehalogenimonas formicexedens]|uniref:Reductive dehalogenase n=1 Tax=Dehalogenimonas formicexedens TaxID=1839801 RepID=A0A1P8F5E6_9CHLR|nr:reductive dehalogenase [Dehalogenimonas formicexedens]APV43701.1 reductive dehalogenase [Dehalogenimonas formicexedens]
MAKFHSTMSRREFMKGLGIAGVGLGAAATAAPMFHDLDELAASGTNTMGHPWWVKELEVEKPDVEIDWDTFKPFSKAKNPMPVIHPEASAANKVRDDGLQIPAFANKTPGDSLRDYAFATGSSFIGPDAPWDGPAGAALPANAKGVAWDDTPENNLQMMRAALHTYGAVLTGAIAVDDTTKNIFDASGFVFDDSPVGSQDANKVYHIPSKSKYMLTFAVKQNYIQTVHLLREDSQYRGGYGTKLALGNQAIGHAYSNSSQVGYMAMRMVKTLGYGAYKAGVTANVPLGIFSGFGEQARTSHLYTPRFGEMIRYTNYFFTDLPLAPSKPISFGGYEFCKSCKRCAERCPSESLSLENERQWDTRSPGNRPGFKGWFMDWQSCIDFGSPGACGNCQATCPFNHPSDGIIHPVVRATAATTGMFDGFFAKMDRVFDYAKARTPAELEGWWSRDLEKYEADTTLGAGTSKW